jgi:hypothetical protein
VGQARIAEMNGLTLSWPQIVTRTVERRVPSVQEFPSLRDTSMAWRISFSSTNRVCSYRARIRAQGLDKPHNRTDD